MSKLPDYVVGSIETLGFTVAFYEAEVALEGKDVPGGAALFARSDQIAAATREFVIAQLEGKKVIIEEAPDD